MNSAKSWLILTIIAFFPTHGFTAGGDMRVTGNIRSDSLDTNQVITGALKITTLNCSSYANGGVVTTGASGVLSCADDDAGGSLDTAYDNAGSGAGRTITADAGAVIIEGEGGLKIDGGALLQTQGAPMLVDTLGIGASPISLYVSGRYAYVVDDVADDLKIIDVSDPTAASVVGTLAFGTGSEPKSVFVSGRYAYVVDQGLDELIVIDVSNPGTPIAVGSVTLGTIFAISVYVSGPYAYVIAWNNKFLVIDVSDPASPAVIGDLAIGQAPRSVYISGLYAYVVDWTSDDIKAIDVSDPSAPTLADSLSIGGSPYAVHVSGRYAYVVDTTSDDLKIIDVSDPTALSLVSSMPLSNPTFLYVSGHFVYVIDDVADELKVVNVSDPGVPVIAGTVGIGGSPDSVFVSGRYAYVVDSVTDDLKVIDLAGMETPSLLAHSLETGNLQVRNDLIAQGQLQVTGGINVGAGGIFSDGNVSVAGTLAFSNDFEPSASPPGQVQLFATDVSASLELVVRDEAGNLTVLSPHDFSLIGKPSEPMAWSYYSENNQGRINVDMLRVVRLVERLSGQKLVYTEPKEKIRTDTPKRGVPASPVSTSIVSSPAIEMLFQESMPALVEALTVLEHENEEKDRQIRLMNKRLEALESRLE